jgi:NADPH:quinone reductase-like Zn-dependent oxidoreductase
MHGYGGVEQLFYEDADEPRLTHPNEVLVKLKAASLNHIDIWNLLGATGIVEPNASHSLWPEEAAW